VNGPGGDRQFRNPVLPGSHPDPSICRVGDDFYLATSTFEYFPGITLHHSGDLVHWRPIGHALDRPAQLPLDTVPASGGLYAPTLRHFDGRFYLVCTLVGGDGPAGNFLVSADDPSGAWSDPVWLPDAPGFDPSLFFDDDGRCWLCGTWEPDPRTEPGRTVIWLQEFDLAAARLLGERRSIWSGAAVDARWSEGPHIYHVDEFYYLLTAEGGTAHDHAVVVARSRSITGPYASCPHNPVLTARHLGSDVPVIGTGHADLVELADGSWWAVLLGMRPLADGTWNLGRETFLTPVEWRAGWPVFNPGHGRILLTGRAPELPAHAWPQGPRFDAFDGPELSTEWLMIRTPREQWWSLTARPGHLRLLLRPPTLADRANPSFVGRRLADSDFTAHTVVDFTPRAEGEAAGLALLHSDAFHIRLEVAGVDERVAQVISRTAAEDRLLAAVPAPDGPVQLGVEAHGQSYVLRVAGEALATVDGRLLSWSVAGGFFGALVGLYATSNAAPSDNTADFAWFEYVALASCDYR
jgi:xylan 1,4-beta-xylosidase